MNPSDAKPDLAQLKLVREDEILRGGIIGSGAFGTVYKGLWITEHLDQKVKIPVAIKVLNDTTSPSESKEFMEEVRVMASVNHSCCIRILGVCLSIQPQIIIQLMPEGTIEFIRGSFSNDPQFSLNSIINYFYIRILIGICEKKQEFTRFQTLAKMGDTNCLRDGLSRASRHCASRLSGSQRNRSNNITFK